MPRAFMFVAPPIQTQVRAAQVTCTLLTFAAGMVPDAPVTVQFNPTGCAATDMQMGSQSAKTMATGSAAGSPNAGSAGAGTSATSGVPSGPANVGGLNNSINDPSGAGNASKVASPPSPGTNSAGTALSSSGTGGGSAQKGPALGTGDPAVDKEDARVARMIGSICRGC